MNNTIRTQHKMLIVSTCYVLLSVEWSGNDSNFRHIKHLDIPDIQQFVNLTVKFGRGLIVALTATWGSVPGDGSVRIMGWLIECLH